MFQARHAGRRAGAGEAGIMSFFSIERAYLDRYVLPQCAIPRTSLRIAIPSMKFLRGRGIGSAAFRIC